MEVPAVRERYGAAPGPSGEARAAHLFASAPGGAALADDMPAQLAKVCRALVNGKGVGTPSAVEGGER
jgi:hypothetical protein